MSIVSIILAFFRFLFVSSSLLFSTGAVLLLFFLVLAGAKTSTPLNEFFWIQVNTSGIPAAPSNGGLTRWTPYNFCGVNSNSKNFDCISNSAAYPFDPVRNFGSANGLPSSFITSSHFYYYTSRFAYAFMLIALFFMVLCLFFGFWALFSRRGALIANIFNFISWVFTVIFASLMTAALVRGRNAFNNDGHHASLGVKMMAFQWTVVALQMLILFTYLFGLCIPATGRNEKNNRNRGYDDGEANALAGGYAAGNVASNNPNINNNPQFSPRGDMNSNDYTTDKPPITTTTNTNTNPAKKSYFAGFSRPGKTSNRQEVTTGQGTGGSLSTGAGVVGPPSGPPPPNTNPNTGEINNSHYRDSVTLADHSENDPNGNWFRSTRKDKPSSDED